MKKEISTLIMRKLNKISYSLGLLSAYIEASDIEPSSKICDEIFRIILEIYDLINDEEKNV